jgi:hypothetical protein
MIAWIADGRVFALLLGCTLLEALGLVVFRAVTKRGLPVADLVFHLAAGAFLTLACWLALTGCSPVAVFASLAASGVTHVVDLARRWRRPR